MQDIPRPALNTCVLFDTRSCVHVPISCTHEGKKILLASHLPSSLSSLPQASPQPIPPPPPSPPPSLPPSRPIHRAGALRRAPAPWMGPEGPLHWGEGPSSGPSPHCPLGLGHLRPQ